MLDTLKNAPEIFPIKIVYVSAQERHWNYSHLQNMKLNSSRKAIVGTADFLNVFWLNAYIEENNKYVTEASESRWTKKTGEE